MSHPTRTRRPIPAVALLTLFFGALWGFCLILSAAPAVAGVIAVLIGATLTALYLKGWVIR
ncbi:hypothetical protein CH252_18940 [Rhodococcus sp. 06-1477-1B]|nr:hypothetical protein CH252_18940 [Rhodococcus sp. 06-1477-1B]